MFRHYAAIDVGTNAVRLLIKRFEKSGGEVYSSKEQLIRVPLRLGFEVFKKNKISKKKEKELTRLMRSFAYVMKIYDVADYMACATSAIRDAENGRNIVKRISEKTGIDIEILDGQQEARGIYRSYVPAGSSRCMYVDVGGGSTEISLVNDGCMVFSRSYNIGTIRMLCNAVSGKEKKQMEDDLRDIARLYTDIRVIGSGGNINKLYRLIDSRDKKQQRITAKSLAELYDGMKDLSVEQRVRNYGLRYDRADVIVPAAEIFLTVTEILKTKYIYVPTVGLSDGIINNLFEQRVKKYGSSSAEGSEKEKNCAAEGTKKNSEKGTNKDSEEGTNKDFSEESKKNSEKGTDDDGMEKKTPLHDAADEGTACDGADNAANDEKANISSNFNYKVTESIPVKTQEASQEETAGTSKS